MDRVVEVGKGRVVTPAEAGEIIADVDVAVDVFVVIVVEDVLLVRSEDNNAGGCEGEAGMQGKSTMPSRALASVSASGEMFSGGAWTLI